MHRRYFMLVVLLFVAVPLFAAHRWGSYHWSRSCGTCARTIEVRRSLSVTSVANWPDHAYKSIYGDPANPNTANRRGWNDSEVLTLNVTNGSSETYYRQNCPAISGAVRVCNYAYGSTGWAGLAQINTVSGTSHIAWGTAKMNDTYYTTNNDPWERHVMCQEIGHDWGLGHTSENGSSQNTCMDYYRNSSTNWTSTGPNQHDFDQIRTQHHWGTSQSLPAQVFASSLGNYPVDVNNLNKPWEWGTPIEWDPEGRASGFVLHLGTDDHGNEQNLYTFVTWAPVGAGHERPKRDAAFE
ncbi:MAG TPA: hypothetical protein VNA69_13160 [Thermoanaerobaculia bacterium]|nr:hypothetical protein [Thermoanaerobaculia bacterium]